jgi:hypothetical protein
MRGGLSVRSYRSLSQLTLMLVLATAIALIVMWQTGAITLTTGQNHTPHPNVHPISVNRKAPACPHSVRLSAHVEASAPFPKLGEGEPEPSKSFLAL